MGGFAALSIGKKLAVIGGGLLAIILALVGLVLAVQAHDKAVKQSGRDEVQAAWNAEKAGRAQAKAEFQGAISAALTPQFDRLASSIGAIDRQAAQISVQLPKAIAAEPRYSDPACALTQPVLDQVNAARALSSNALEPQP